MKTRFGADKQNPRRVLLFMTINKRILLVTVLVASCGVVRGGTVQFTPANVSAILSAVSSGMDIAERGRASTPIVSAKRVGAVMSHPLHPKAALQRLKLTKGTK